jgi:hypothetical protein
MGILKYMAKLLKNTFNHNNNITLSLSYNHESPTGSINYNNESLTRTIAYEREEGISLNRQMKNIRRLDSNAMTARVFGGMYIARQSINDFKQTSTFPKNLKNVMEDDYTTEAIYGRIYNTDLMNKYLENINEYTPYELLINTYNILNFNINCRFSKSTLSKEDIENIYFFSFRNDKINLQQKWEKKFGRKNKEVMLLTIIDIFNYKQFKFLEEKCIGSFSDASFREKVAFIEFYKKYRNEENLFYLEYIEEIEEVRKNNNISKEEKIYNRHKEYIDYTYKNRTNKQNIKPWFKEVYSYQMEILERDNKEGFYLGYNVDCCQTIGGSAETCITAGYMHEDYSFFTLKKDNKLIAHSILVFHENFIFIDSIESLDYSDISIGYTELITHIKETYPNKNIAIGGSFHFHKFENFLKEKTRITINLKSEIVEGKEIYSDLNKELILI